MKAKARPDQKSMTSMYLAYVSAFSVGRALLQSTVILYLVDVLQMPLALAGYLLAIDLFVTLVAEIPTGYLADRYGRRKSFIAACALSSLGALLYGIPLLLPVAGEQILLFTFAGMGEVALSLGFACYSGALDAWIVDTADPLGKQSQRLILARGQLTKSLSTLAGGLVGILVYYRFSDSALLNVFAFSALVLAATFAHALACMPKGSEEQLAWTGRILVGSGPDLRKSLFQQLLRAPPLALMLSAAVSFALLQLLIHYWPVFLNEEARREGRPLDAKHAMLYSWIVAYGARSLGAYVATLVTEHKPLPLYLAVASFTAAITVLAFGISDYRVVDNQNLFVISTLYATVRLLDGFSEPLRLGLLTEMSSAPTRATFYSVYSSFCMMVGFVAAMVSGQMLSIGHTVATVWMLFAAVQLACVPAYVIVWKSRT